MILRRVSYKEKERILQHALMSAKPLASAKDFVGTSPAPFVGRFGYPHVNVGLLAPPQHDENAWTYDAPRYWASSQTSMTDIACYRTRMINSRFQSNVKNPHKYTLLAQEVAMAKTPADIEVSLKKSPQVNLTTDQYHAPMGPSAALHKLALTSNPRIHTKVQRAFADTDLLASEAVTSLYGRVDENALSRMLSVGVFGKDRTLVPTRWSITATDDTLAKHFLEKVRDLPIGDFRAHFGHYLGNYYLVLLFPERWRYELFEMYVKPGVLEYSTDYEEFQGRKNYASQTAGGYYTVRMALAEHMTANKRQHGALVLRFITDEYVLPLGVWVTREATRKALSNTPITFVSKELMLTYAKKLAKQKFGIDLDPLLFQSKFLKERQHPLSAFA